MPSLFTEDKSIFQNKYFWIIALDIIVVGFIVTQFWPKQTQNEYSGQQIPTEEEIGVTKEPDKAIKNTCNDDDIRAYITKLSNNVKYQWHPANTLTNKKHEEASVYFEVSKSGKLHKAGIAKSSGKKPFDYYALQTIKRAAPFPPHPPCFKQQFIRLEFNLEANFKR